MGIGADSWLAWREMIIQIAEVIADHKIFSISPRSDSATRIRFLKRRTQCHPSCMYVLLPEIIGNWLIIQR